MDKYYLVIGPREFKEDEPCKWWIKNGIWAKDIIVTYAAEQPADEPGKLFRIVYKPENAPPAAKRLRLPEDWVIEIPCFKYIDKDPSDMWTIENGMVVRR